MKDPPPEPGFRNPSLDKGFIRNLEYETLRWELSSVKRKLKLSHGTLFIHGQ